MRLANRHSTGKDTVSNQPAANPRPMSADELDVIHAAWVAGYEYGLAERQRLEVDDQVRARLHEQALQALGMAHTLAAEKGPAWAAMIEQAGEVDD